MKGLLRKIFIEVRWPVLLFGIGLMLVMAVSYTHLTLPTICSV